MCSRVVREGHSIGSLGDDGAISDHHRGKRPASPAAHILNGQRDGLLHKPVLHAPTSRGPRLYRNLLPTKGRSMRSEEHTSELQSRLHLVCRLLLEKKKKKN